MATIRQLYIGSNFAGLNLYEENGTAMASAPYVTLHDRERGKYYVADHVQLNEDEVSYDVAWSAEVTERMQPGSLALEVFTASNMENARLVAPDWVIAIKVSPTPGEENDSTAQE